MAQLSNNKVFFLFIFYQTQNSFQYAANIRTVILLNFALTRWNAISTGCHQLEVFTLLSSITMLVERFTK